MPKKYLCFILLLTMLLSQPFLDIRRPASAGQATPAPTCDSVATPVGSPIATPRITTPASPSPVRREFDQLYLDLMIIQQTQINEIARLAAVRAETQELQRLSAEIVSTSESTLEQLGELRVKLFEAAPLAIGPELMGELDELARQQPGAGGIAGAMDIVAGNNILDELCRAQGDSAFVNGLIEQLDAGIVLSSVAIDLASRDETKVIALQIIALDRPFEDGAIAIRDGVLGATPVATPAGGGL